MDDNKTNIAASLIFRERIDFIGSILFLKMSGSLVHGGIIHGHFYCADHVQGSQTY